MAGKTPTTNFSLRSLSLPLLSHGEVVVSGPQPLGPRDRAPLRASSPFVSFLSLVSTQAIVTGSAFLWGLLHGVKKVLDKRDPPFPPL